MIEQNPDILYDLYQARAHDLPHRATMFQLAKLSNPAPASVLWRTLAQLGTSAAKALRFSGVGHTLRHAVAKSDLY